MKVKFHMNLWFFEALYKLIAKWLKYFEMAEIFPKWRETLRQT